MSTAAARVLVPVLLATVTVLVSLWYLTARVSAATAAAPPQQDAVVIGVSADEDAHPGSIRSDVLSRPRIRRHRLPLGMAHSVAANETQSPAADLADALYYCRAETALLLQHSTHSPAVVATAQTPSISADDRWPAGGFFCAGTWKRLAAASDASAEPRVRVDYCAHTHEGLSGAFRVAKLANCRASNTSYTQWTNDDEWRAAVDASYASEEFQLSLAGAELLALEPVHRGHCRFELPFRVSVPGRYLVDFVWTREDYAAVRDDVAAHPVAVVNRPLGLLFIELGSAADAREAHARALSGHGLPSCVGHRHIMHGRWLRTSLSPDGLFDKHVVPGKYRQLAFVRLRDYAWAPWACRLPSMRALAYELKCMDVQTKGLQLEISGDSHGLRVLKAMGLFLCANVAKFHNFTIKEAHSYHYQLSDCDSPAGLVVFNAIYHGESLLQALTPAIARLTLVNFGSHLMQQPAPFAVRYRPPLEALVAKWSQLPRSVRTRRVVWYDMPVSPFDRGGFVTGYKDGRTLARCRLWNALAHKRMRGVDGFLRVPLGAMSAPFFYNNPNNDGHYDPKLYLEVARAAAAMTCDSTGGVR